MLRLLLYLLMAMRKCSNAFFSESTIESVLFITINSCIGVLYITRMQFWPNDLSFGSFELIRGQIRFLHLTFDRIEIQGGMDKLVHIVFFNSNAGSRLTTAQIVKMRLISCH